MFKLFSLLLLALLVIRYKTKSIKSFFWFSVRSLAKFFPFGDGKTFRQHERHLTACGNGNSTHLQVFRSGRGFLAGNLMTELSETCCLFALMQHLLISVFISYQLRPIDTTKHNTTNEKFFEALWRGKRRERNIRGQFCFGFSGLGSEFISSCSLTCLTFFFTTSPTRLHHLANQFDWCFRFPQIGSKVFHSPQSR